MLSMVLGFLGIGTPELLLIMFAILILFGGKKLPELARGLGKGLREFKDASETIKKDISDQINDFEKDLDVKNLLEEEPETPKKVEEKEVKSDEAAATTMSAPAGTYQHVPGREPDYYGSQDVYYNESNNNTQDPQNPQANPELTEGQRKDS